MCIHSIATQEKGYGFKGICSTQMDAKVRVFRANQGETHFSFVRDTGLETLAGMAAFQISSYVAVLIQCWDLP